MHKFALSLAIALLTVGPAAMAMDDMKTDKPMDMKMAMKMMDANNDGMISKEEFMKHHEMMYDKMKKNKGGMVDVKDMEMMHQHMQMMHKGKTMGKDDMTKKDAAAK